MCLSDFEEATKVDPKNADVHFHLGQVKIDLFFNFSFNLFNTFFPFLDSSSYRSG
jgi:hypothetical protein